MHKAEVYRPKLVILAQEDDDLIGSPNALLTLSNCSFSSPSVTPGSGTASSTVTITTSPHSSAMFRTASLQRLSYVFAVFLPVGLVLLGGRRDRKSVRAFMLLVGLASVCFHTGCSGGGSSGGSGGTGGTPAGTYTIQVTGTAGSLAHSATLTLTVQ